MAMARTMARMRMFCCLSGFSGLPVLRWEEGGGMSKPLRSLEQQEPPLALGGGMQDDHRPAYDSRPSVSSFEKWEEGMSKPLWSLKQQEPPLPSGGGIQDDRPAYYGGGTAYYGGGIQDRPAYSPPYYGDRPSYYGGGTAYYGGGIQDDRPTYSPPDRPSYYGGGGTAYYGGGIQDDRPTYSPPYYGDRPSYYGGGTAYYGGGIQDDRPTYSPPDRPSYYGGGGTAYYGGGIQDDRPAYSPPYYGDRPSYYGGGTAYYGGGIQDDRSAYSPPYYGDRPSYYGGGTAYYGGGIQDDRSAYSPPYYDDRPCGGIQDDRPATYYGVYGGDRPAPIYHGDRPAPIYYGYGDAIQEDHPDDYGGGIQDDGPSYSPPPYSPPPYADDDYYDYRPSGPSYSPTPPTPPTRKYIDMGLLRPWRLPPPPVGIPSSHSDGTPPAQRWWEVEFKKPWRLPPSGTPGVQFDNRPAPQLSMVGSNSNWEGRLKRFKLGRTFGPYPNYSLEDCVAFRVYSIAQYFKYSNSVDLDDINVSESPEQFEYWLDDVQGYFEFMELAHELHSIDCLYDLLHYVLVHPHPLAAFRAKTAELVTTMVHNNPRSQQLVIELNGLQPLWYNFTKDPDATSRTKALGAISALIRNNKPGITAFRERNGYAALGDALSSENVWFQREALNLIQYLLHENSSDCNTVTELGLPRIMMHLASSDDAEVRVAALGGLLVLAQWSAGKK